MELFEFLGSPQQKKIKQRVEEIKKLYEVSEAEMKLIQQTLMIIKVSMDMSPKLTAKVLKVLAAVTEMINEELPDGLKLGDE
jgi:hypothetical protein